MRHRDAFGRRRLLALFTFRLVGTSISQGARSVVGGGRLILNTGLGSGEASAAGEGETAAWLDATADEGTGALGLATPVSAPRAW